LVSLDKAIVVRYEKAGERFEVLVDPDLAWNLRQGKEVDMDELLAAPEIFRDARKGERASTEELHKAFGTTDPYQIAKIIIQKGDFHPTTEQRRRMLEEKRNKIATIIAQRSINPQTNTPHPVSRILKAMEEDRVAIDPFKPAEDQIQGVLDKIKRVIPIRIETRKIEAIIPASYVGKAYGRLKAYNIVREKYLNDGSLQVVIEIPAGLTDELLKFLNDITHGGVKTRLIE
jgi:ribosome maturation protein SDO1